MITKQRSFDPSHLIMDETILEDSMRCSRIENLITGAVFVNNGDPDSRWELLYQQASLCPKEFKCTYERKGTLASKVGHRYVKKELDGMSITNLRRIARQFGIEEISKSKIIPLILSMQDEECEAI